ncbi:MAG: flagellar basal-body rod protein FlgF [Halioglobus sp.]|jgi:flagellar basal-body rod protein FlgF
MDHLVYLASSGAREAMLAQAANTNNLANASTTGFRADLLLAQSAYLSSDQLDSRVYAGVNNGGVDFRQGTVNATGRDLDVAISGEGWITIAAGEGAEAFSRRGDLRVNQLGQLLDGAGNQIIGNSGPIALPPYTEIAIGADGTISIIPLGGTADTLAVVDRIKLVNPDAGFLNKNANGQIQFSGDEAVFPDTGVTLMSGSLESSNVDSVGAMVQMIDLSRQFEYQVQMMKVAEELDQASAQLMKLS